MTFGLLAEISESGAWSRLRSKGEGPEPEVCESSLGWPSQSRLSNGAKHMEITTKESKRAVLHKMIRGIAHDLPSSVVGRGDVAAR